MGAEAGWLDCRGRAAGKAEKEPHLVVRTVHELGAMLISRCLGVGTGLDVLIEGREGLQVSEAVLASESVCLVCKSKKPE